MHRITMINSNPGPLPQHPKSMSHPSIILYSIHEELIPLDALPRHLLLNPVEQLHADLPIQAACGHQHLRQHTGDHRPA